MKRAFKQLARDLTEFLEEFCREVEWVLKVARGIFVDTKWNPKKYKSSKKYICYDPEENVFFEVDSLTELKILR